MQIKDSYVCPRCGYVLPKKDAIISEYDSQSSLRHISSCFVLWFRQDRCWRLYRDYKTISEIDEKKYGKNWEGSLSFEKVIRYLPHFKSAIQLPIYVIGIDL